MHVVFGNFNLKLKEYFIIWVVNINRTQIEPLTVYLFSSHQILVP